MARTITEIKTTIANHLKNNIGENLSTSSVAEWKLFAYIVAVVTHTLEVIFDLFRSEIEDATEFVTPGTPQWYARMARQFRPEHTLAVDDYTGMFTYRGDSQYSNPVQLVAVVEGSGELVIKIASLDNQNEIKEFDTKSSLFSSFQAYMNTIAMAGTKIKVSSTPADHIKYGLDVYYDPTFSESQVENGVEEALDVFRKNMPFDAVFYKQQFIEAIMQAEGVVTVDKVSIDHKYRDKESESEYKPLNSWVELTAGFFNYDPDSSINYISLKSDEREKAY